MTMNNFYDFIEKDVSAKQTLISTMPTKTKTNIKKFNEKIDETSEKYEEYKTSVRNYLLAKSRSFEVKDAVTDITKLKENVLELEHVRFLLNPSNTFFEKMGFDGLLYQISNYYVFNFHSLSDIINGFLDKFELAGILLTDDDFDYTCYVHEYMSSFLEVRRKKDENYTKVNEIFEQIYWLNPEIIEHIELNFRKLIKKNSKKFNNYILKLQKDAMTHNNVKNYFDCQEKLQSLYIELNIANKEDINDIITLAKSNQIDINQYMVGNKVRTAAFTSIIDSNVDLKDEKSMKKICGNLEKLKINIEEYKNYLEIIPLIDDFKKEYEKLIPDPNAKKNDKKNEYKGLKEVETEIDTKENELAKINRKIFGGKPGFFEFKSDNDLKELKIDSLRKAKDLYNLYQKYDEEYFKDKVLSILSSSLSISDLLNLYYSFDYFKKLAAKRVLNIASYEDIIKYSETFDLFAMDPTNIIVKGLALFDEPDIARIIINKYKLGSLNLSEDEVSPDNLDALINKILLILRVHKIENSSTSLEKIWFMVQVEKMITKEQKNASK